MDDKALLSEALARASGLPQADLEPLLEVPPTPDMGDYALPCFKLARLLRKAPPAIYTFCTRRFFTTAFLLDVPLMESNSDALNPWIT